MFIHTGIDQEMLGNGNWHLQKDPNTRRTGFVCRIILSLENNLTTKNVERIGGIDKQKKAAPRTCRFLLAGQSSVTPCGNSSSQNVKSDVTDMVQRGQELQALLSSIL